ncbi:MAG: hypothetical protein ACYTGX_05675 [Planctomycetota bacterium]|jgi:hypothetical protein
MSSYSYAATLAASEKGRWTIADVLPEGAQFDFGQRFLPERLARVDALAYLDADERRTLNQIRANAYLVIFGLVEEFILPFVMDHARPYLDQDDYRTRALLQFAEDEAKHIHLFKQFRAAFEQGFGYRCDVIGPPDAVAKHVLGHSPLGVALAILHIEWMTQRHYLEGIKEGGALEPQFESLLRHHWIDEAQHAKLDTLMVEVLADGATPEEIQQGLDDYLAIGGFIDEALKQQVEFDLDAFQRATGRTLTEAETSEFRTIQLQANRWTYLGSAMTHPNVLETLEYLGTEHRARIEEVAPLFC